ncbi:eukaryotic translation initiation factor 3 subunit B-like [Xyrauchen texanus]|uniref:eukaryotic translation initiation factor 3 subunit B-like n=1 Tax=Xyrauchen texanus TaxID=154827 RepID=UPI002241A33B|nr:eukaryotic translation initiation factor 3 subunit B-like [Xyrauchen texanus]
MAKAYSAAGRATSTLHAIAILQFHQAKALKELHEGGPDPGVMQELCLMTDLALRLTKVTAWAFGQAMSTMVIQERHLVLNLVEMRDTDKVHFLDAPSSQAILFDDMSRTLPSSSRWSRSRDFSWSPGDNLIAFWVSEDKDIPARVMLMQFPSRLEIRVCNLFNVVDCKLHWQRQGDYLFVKVDRTPRGIQVVVTNFEIFRMREKQVLVDVVEMKESIIAFAWETNGNKFAVLHGESPRINASFYHIKSNSKIELIKMFDKQQANSIFWSPLGQFMVLAGLRRMNGALAFVDTSDCTIMNIAEHYMASDVELDPTGRYVVTYVSWWSHKVDNAYWLWTFQGHLLQKNSKDRFCQLLWRPCPPTLLSPEQIKVIKKNLKKYSKIFEQKDRLSLSKASKELVDKCRLMMEEYRQYRGSDTQMYNQQRDLSLQLRGGVDTDELDSNVEDWEEETIEFFISEDIIPVGDL